MKHRTFLPFLAIAFFASTVLLTAAPQDDQNADPSKKPKQQTPAGEPGRESSPVNKRVQALLDRMLQQESFLCRARYSIQNPLTGIMMIAGRNPGKKAKKKKVEVLQTHKGELDFWAADRKKPTLFRQGGLWVLPIEGDYALAQDRTQCPEWSRKILPDGRLFTKALKALLPQCQWKNLGSDTYDDRPVLVWRCRLSGKAARQFHVSHLTQDPSNSAMGFMLVLNLPGMKQIKKLDVQLEITLYEDPAHKLPIRATIRTFLPRKMGNGPGGVIIQVQGNQDEEEEEEGKEKEEIEGETKTHKLAGNLEFLFSRWGRVKAPTLPETVKHMLEGTLPPQEKK
ncbi:MAG TPA: hypothetical protein ENK02_07815 [Planctomycetes bacterium]|nr:hypothetical protein [Planctomycetota bacterium]